MQDAAELAARRADERQQAEEEQAKALLSQMQQNADATPAAPDPEAEKKAEEDRKRQEHEQAEAKRKAEWEAKQRAKEEAEQAAWENAVAMSDDEVMAASMKRVGDDSERLTRRNMKQCVTEYIQTLCLEDVAFARNVMHPRKNKVNCFRYINRRAFEFAKQEMEDNDVMVIPPHSSKELIDEGTALRHCVGRYVKWVAQRECVILFVRKVAEPDKSLCSVEVRDGQVVQTRGFDNEDPPAKIKAFIERWKRQVQCAADKSAA